MSLHPAIGFAESPVNTMGGVLILLFLINGRMSPAIDKVVSPRAD